MNAAPAIEAGITIDGARRLLSRVFDAAGIESSPLDARVLIGHAIGLDHAELAAATAYPLTSEQRARLADMAIRRMRREPVARIIGMKEFWGLPLRINAATLVPRPETETVVETALAAIDKSGSREHAMKIADLGTGSGALLLALLTELPNASGVGTDISEDTLNAARENAQRLGLGRRADFVACDFGAGLDGGFDVIVSNPPYAETQTIASLPPDVRDFDPRRALDGGPDGLAAYRAIAADTARLLKPDGLMLLEIGAGQGSAVKQLLQSRGLTVVAVVPDLAGIPRVVRVRR